MYSFKSYFLVASFLVIAFSCKKDGSGEVTVDSVKSSLHNGLSKTWTLSKLYVNGTQMTLTPGQARYTKTYKVDNTWLDSDGYLGTYSVTSVQSMTEITTNATGGARTIVYSIKSCNSTQLDVEYTLAANTYRLVFGL